MFQNLLIRFQPSNTDDEPRYGAAAWGSGSEVKQFRSV